MKEKYDFEMRIDANIIESLRESQRIDIYLMESDALLEPQLYKTFTCYNVFLKADDSLFRVEGVNEDFGCPRDEVQAIDLYKGWLHFEDDEKMNKTRVMINDFNKGWFNRFRKKRILAALMDDLLSRKKEPIVYHDFDYNRMHEFIHYDSIFADPKLDIFVLKIDDEIYHDTKDEYYSVYKEQAIVISNSKQKIFIGQDVFSYMLKISQHPYVLDKVLNCNENPFRNPTWYR